MSKYIKINLPQIIGKGYKSFWNFKGRYKVVKGSRASKKSKTTALWIIYNMMKYKNANTLVVRKVFRTLKDSCYSDLRWAINRFQVQDYWEFKESPLEITYKPTGQKILFRGFDDPLKITSISVSVGSLCWCWIEEAYELTDETAFNMLDESIRGVVEEPLFKQIIISFNPWNERHWLKSRFFDKVDDNILALTTNYQCNEWLDDADKKLFEDMKKNNPRRYQVAGLGNWGIVDGLVYENWQELEFDWREILNKRQKAKAVFGLDFGYTNDPAAFFCGILDQEQKEIYVFDEIYQKGMQNTAVYSNIEKLGFKKEIIVADSAEPKSIDHLKGLGLYRIKASKKGKDSINAGIQFIQDFKIFIHPRCVNFLTEISNYAWDKDKFGKAVNKPIDDFNHLMDAMRYALEDYMRNNSVRTIDRNVLGIR
ncbi:PBSX family phage terminase large subunit [Fusobacterium pseudoperiodonticum]|uniref:PBSX family phage terminase large subunit n=1 Tax=Fusobacterium pseudoperiodonticum TaxID=2663009 RepID=UPI0028E800CE|nr:PBSX family phage terminase large subunit [Fusobacterium pseudoperiodonticum]